MWLSCKERKSEANTTFSSTRLDRVNYREVDDFSPKSPDSRVSYSYEVEARNDEEAAPFLLRRFEIKYLLFL